MKNIPIDKILFLDIETAPLFRSLENLPEYLREYWLRRYDKKRLKDTASIMEEEYFLEKSGIHALYSRVVCIGMGFFAREENGYKWRTQVLTDLLEKQILLDFITFWDRFKQYSRRGLLDIVKFPVYGLCGHNIMSFDIPFLGRRFLLNSIPLPDFWKDNQYKKPWQLEDPLVIDTMLLWNFTAYENSFIPLEVLAGALGLPFSKSLSHTEIREAFYRWEDSGDRGEFDPVVKYCMEDVRVVAAIYLLMQQPEGYETFLNILGYESPHYREK